jgi:DNA invertase Pin-like site-specific DNA recombinase
MKSYFAYIRVSTQKQGLGVSLQEQKTSIERYADRQGLRICAWFEELETAAKRGRPIFGRMLKDLGRGKADGIIIHKIDRSARNLKDWADLGELIDRGYQVHFATETLDLTSRGGRLSADIQAVVAADYIRNLREETRKGFYGRLRQGLFPMRAPIGYLDRGGGKPKEPDPVMAPLVRRTFELYATGEYSLQTLRKEAARIGLRNLAGKPLSMNGMSTLLNNPFYIGIMQIDKTKETFRGIHTPILSTKLFDRVQNILRGRFAPRTRKHSFLFRRMFHCAHCTRVLTGESQKGYVYYSCHTPTCPTTSVREDRADGTFGDEFSYVVFSDDEVLAIEHEIRLLTSSQTEQLDETTKALELQRAQLQARTDRLVDAYVDKLIDKDAFEARRSALIFEEARLKEQIATLSGGDYRYSDGALELFELTKSLYSSYISANPDEKRHLVERTTSNRAVDGKNLAFELKSPFREVANRSKSRDGDAERDDIRTIAQLFITSATSLRMDRPILDERSTSAVEHRKESEILPDQNGGYNVNEIANRP